MLIQYCNVNEQDAQEELTSRFPLLAHSRQRVSGLTGAEARTLSPPASHTLSTSQSSRKPPRRPRTPSQRAPGAAAPPGEGVRGQFKDLLEGGCFSCAHRESAQAGSEG